MPILHPTRRKYTVPMVARMMGVAERKVLDWIRAGELRAVNLRGLRMGVRVMPLISPTSRHSSGHALLFHRPTNPSQDSASESRRA